MLKSKPVVFLIVLMLVVLVIPPVSHTETTATYEMRFLNQQQSSGVNNKFELFLPASTPAPGVYSYGPLGANGTQLINNKTNMTTFAFPIRVSWEATIAVHKSWGLMDNTQANFLIESYNPDGTFYQTIYSESFDSATRKGTAIIPANKGVHIVYNSGHFGSLIKYGHNGSFKISYQQEPDATNNGSNGLLAEYYNANNLTNLRYTKVDAQVNNDWMNGSPQPGMAWDNFSVRWTGKIKPRYTEAYTFYTLSDDGVRLWVNNQQIINNWTDHTATENTGIITLTAGQEYDIRLEYYEKGTTAQIKLSWSSVSQLKEIVPASCLTPAQNGLTAEYFDNPDFTNLKLKRIDAVIDANWGTGQPLPEVGADTFSIRWSGKISPKFSETYTFYSSASNGVKLWVNGKLVINDWGDYSGVRSNSGTIALTANVKYDILVEYYESTQDAFITLSWSSVSQGQEIIPSSCLSPQATTSVVHGLRAEYYNIYIDSSYLINYLYNLQKVKIDAKVDFNWGGGAPDQFIIANCFSIRWTGKIKPRYSEMYTFYTYSDDGVRLWVNGQLFIDNWTNHSPIENSGTITLTAGQEYDIRLEYYENEGDAQIKLSWSSASQPKDVIQPEFLYPGPQTGLKAEYYDNSDFTNLKVVRIDRKISYLWPIPYTSGTDSPSPEIGGDTFSIRWTGTIKPKYSETYTFYTVSDDGVRFWVNGQLLIDNWVAHSATENNATITLIAGQEYNIKLEYYENTADAQIRLLWSSASQVKEVVPSECLSPGIAVGTVSNLNAIVDQPSRRIDLSWSGMKDLYNDVSIAGYQIQYQLNGGSWQVLPEIVTVTNWSMTNAAYGKYIFQVRMVDQNGRYSEWSASSTEVTIVYVPAVITSISATSMPNNYRVVITVPVTTEATGYVYYRKYSNGVVVRLTETAVTTTTYTDSINLFPHGQYEYGYAVVINGYESEISWANSQTMITPALIAPKVLLPNIQPSVIVSGPGPIVVNCNVNFTLGPARDMENDQLRYGLYWKDTQTGAKVLIASWTPISDNQVVTVGMADKLTLEWAIFCIEADESIIDATEVQVTPWKTITVDTQYPLPHVRNVFGEDGRGTKGQPLTCLVETNPNVVFDSFIWNFGDGSPTASGQQVTHVYQQLGQYEVTVTATSNGVQYIGRSTVIITNTNRGQLYADETWSGTHQLNGDVTVPNGITLTVDSGAQIKVNPGLALLIKGIIQANGGAFDVEGSGQWKGIRFMESGGGTISGATIRHAERGVACTGTGTINLQNTTFSENNTGVHCFSGSVIITGCSFSGNTIYGIKEELGCGAPFIQNCSFQNNGIHYYDADRYGLTIEQLNEAPNSGNQYQ
jgi:hypothetical protein